MVKPVHTVSGALDELTRRTTLCDVPVLIVDRIGFQRPVRAVVARRVGANLTMRCIEMIDSLNRRAGSIIALRRVGDPNDIVYAVICSCLRADDVTARNREITRHRGAAALRSCHLTSLAACPVASCCAIHSVVAERREVAVWILGRRQVAVLIVSVRCVWATV